VSQTDIICYGRDLAEYVGNEWGHPGPRSYSIAKPVKSIDFWSYLVTLNSGGVDDGMRRP